MTTLNEADARFIKALRIVADITPYKPLKDAIKDAENLAPQLSMDEVDPNPVNEDWNPENAEDQEVPSDKALAELREKLTKDDSDLPAYARPVGNKDIDLTDSVDMSDPEWRP